MLHSLNMLLTCRFLLWMRARGDVMFSSGFGRQTQARVFCCLYLIRAVVASVTLLTSINTQARAHNFVQLLLTHKQSHSFTLCLLSRSPLSLHTHVQHVAGVI